MQDENSVPQENKRSGKYFWKGKKFFSHKGGIDFSEMAKNSPKEPTKPLYRESEQRVTSKIRCEVKVNYHILPWKYKWTQVH